MSTELDTAKRYRQPAEELRTIAADKLARENRPALLQLAVDYDRMAKTMETIDATNKTLRALGTGTFSGKARLPLSQRKPDSMNDFSDLTPLERMKTYRELAARALKDGANAETEAVREHYRFVAAQWEDLAKDIEQRHPPQLE